MIVLLPFVKDSDGLEEVNQVLNFLSRFGVKEFENTYFDVDDWFLNHKIIQIFLVYQPLVPTISAEYGKWLVAEPFTPVCKPGGHGVIWKLAQDKGVFRWFHEYGRKAATVRQVRLALFYTSKIKILSSL